MNDATSHHRTAPMIIFRASSRLVFIALVAAACGGGLTEATTKAAVHIVSGDGMTDTIGALLAEPLLVEVSDAAGRRAVGVDVHFDADSLPPSPYCFVASCTRSPATLTIVVKTDSTGRAVAPIWFGTVAGTAHVVVNVPSLGVAATANYMITAGRAARVALAPRDTFVYIGTTTAFRTAVVDRAGNQRSETATLTATSATPVTGTSLAAASFGVHSVIGSYSGVRTDTTSISVVPRGTIAALESYYQGLAGSPPVIVVFDLDGSRRAKVTLSGEINGFAWMAGGTQLAFSQRDPAGFRLYTTALTGGSATPLLGTHPAADEERPALSNDGHWLYFAEKDWTNRYRWRPWRARADGTVPELIGDWVSGTSAPVTSTLGPSPDGARVAYSSEDCCPSGSSLIVVDAATRATASFAITGTAPRWSPLGNEIAYGDRTGPWVLNPDGTGARQFPTAYFGSSDLTLDWSPDGRWLIIPGNESLELLDVQTGQLIPLNYTAGYLQPVWKP